MKYNKKRIGGYIMALLFTGLAVSCSKEQLMEPTLATPDAADLQIKTVDEGNYHGEIVPLELAKLVAQKTEFQKLYGGLDSTKGAKGARVATAAKVIQQAVSLRDKHNQPALHVINYRNGGFAILSAERSAQPVLAFSDEGQFQADKLPDGVKGWVEDNRNVMEQLRTRSASTRSARKASSASGLEWDQLLAMTGLIRRGSTPNARAQGGIDGPICHTCPPEPNPDPCDKFWLGDWRGPYTKTTWNQSGGHPAHTYNVLAHNNALAGCGPVAMGQLMAFFRYPATYTNPFYPGTTRSIVWGIIPNAESNYATADLLRNIADASYVKWGGPGQETTTNIRNMEKALRNHFGYKHVTYYESYKSSDLLMQLNSGIPVLLDGDATKGPGGHVWVCDGYKKINSNCATSEIYYWHMNWGWGGTGNGYFSDYETMLNESTNKGVGGNEVYLENRHMIVARP
jgi:Peptidase C10 family/Spi protease inhibitor